jgi:hypothetical protein
MIAAERIRQFPKKELLASPEPALKYDKPYRLLRKGRAKGVTKKCNSKMEHSKTIPSGFRRDFIGFCAIIAKNIIPRPFHSLRSVPNSVAIRKSLDKLCLEIGQAQSCGFGSGQDGIRPDSQSGNKMDRHSR